MILMYVEDDADDAFLLERATNRRSGTVKVVHMESGELAVAYLKQAAKAEGKKEFPTPGVLITDVSLGGMSGEELLRWLSRQRELDLMPRAALGVGGWSWEEERLLTAGADVFFAKEPGLEKVCDWVERCASGEETRAELRGERNKVPPLEGGCDSAESEPGDVEGTADRGG